MPQERYRTISLNDFVERFPLSLDILGGDSKALRKTSHLEPYSKSFKETAFESYFASNFDKFPRVEYVGSVPLNRSCAHGNPMMQFKLVTKNISIQCMNDLIDMGWRRDGNNFYKTAIDCCHTYALRMNPHNFKLGRQHRKILNHFADFFKYGENKTAAPKNGKPKNKQATQDDFTLEAYIRRIVENCDAHKFEARLVKPGTAAFRESYEESFALFKKYYESVHNKDYGKEDFESAMVSTPLSMFGNEQNPNNFGTFHRQYRIDGRLVGVEMFDVLPNYLVAQASFYDTDMSHLNLGTFMILEHISFAQKLSTTLGRTLQYSTGLYNHCFKKHHYKLAFADEILTNDEIPKWILYSKDLLPQLESEEKIVGSDSTLEKRPELSSVPCYYNGKILKYGTLEDLLSEAELGRFDQKLAAYVQEVGVVAEKMIIYLN